VVSYNIHQCIGTDGRCDPARVAQVIAELGADLLGLQEVDARSDGVHASGQLDYLAKATGLEAVAGLVIRHHTADFGNVLLTSHRVLAVRNIDLSIPGREPRAAIDTDIAFHGMPLRVIVTHLGLAGHERRLQVRRLLHALCAPSGALTIVLGDINEWSPRSRALRWLHQRLGRTPVLRTFPSRCPLFALDRIWVDPAMALQRVRVHHSPLARIASDHLPLTASIDVEQGAVGEPLLPAADAAADGRPAGHKAALPNGAAPDATGGTACRQHG
jgi:endonuclease/exonuclease/phosphatase family metal-dependent hydrolase